MLQEDAIRAWKDEDFRLSLNDEQLAMLPDNPAGLLELSDGDLTDDNPDWPLLTVTVTLPICPTLWTCLTLTCSVTIQPKSGIN